MCSQIVLQREARVNLQEFPEFFNRATSLLGVPLRFLIETSSRTCHIVELGFIR